MALMRWLADERVADPAEPLDVWLNGELRSVLSRNMNLGAEPRPSPFPAAGTALNLRIHEAIGRGEFEEALALAERLRAMHPDVPMALINVAAIEEAMGRPVAELAALFRQAHEMAPDYLFARCGLARCLAGEGRIEEARALLHGLIDREDWHYSEYRSFMLAQRALAEATGEHAAVRTANETLLELDRQFPR